MSQALSALAASHNAFACGAVGVRVDAAPKEVILPLHDMPAHHSAPFGVYAIFERASVSVSGETKAWQSSATGQRHHCPTCGSPVFLTFDGIDEIEVPTGIFDETSLYLPQYEIWC